MTITFERTADEMILMAAYVSELVRQGVTFKTHKNLTNFSVELTGGF